MSDGPQHPAILASDAARGATVDRLRQAVVDGRLTLGTVTLIVPEGVRVSLEGGGPFASQVIHSPEVPPVQGAPLLRIKASCPGGTLHVRNQRERPNRLFKLLGKGDPYA